jgi:hypothetical protein
VRYGQISFGRVCTIGDRSSILPAAQAGDFRTDHGSVHFLFTDGAGLLTLGRSSTSASGRVVAEDSFAESPSGQRLKILTEPHAYDVGREAPNIRTRILVLNGNGKAAPSLKDGRWKFSFLIRNRGKERRLVFISEIYTFYYSPFLHGPPA